MGATLLRSMKPINRGEREMIYALITDTAESNLHPICYNHWPIAAGRKYEVMKTICRMPPMYTEACSNGAAATGDGMAPVPSS